MFFKGLFFLHTYTNANFQATTVNTFTSFVTDIFHVYLQTELINSFHGSPSSYQFNDNRSSLSMYNVRTNATNSQIVWYMTVYQLAYTYRSVDGQHNTTRRAAV